MNFRIFGYVVVYIAINVAVYQRSCGSVVIMHNYFLEVMSSIHANGKL